MPYRELYENFELNIGQNEQSLVRYFIYTPYSDATFPLTSIPKKGDIFNLSSLPDFLSNSIVATYPDQTFNNLHVTSVKIQPFQNKSEFCISYLVTYGTEINEFTRITEDIQIGGEYFVINYNGGVTASLYNYNNNTVSTQIRKWISNCIYTRTQIFTTMTDALTFTSLGGDTGLYFSDYQGKVKPDYITDGHWLMNGVGIQEITGPEGDKYYKQMVTYSYKKIEGDNVYGPGGTQGGWNMVYNPSYNTWETTNPLTYVMTADATDWPHLMPVL